ncbi:MAG: XdhC family protein, partial [Spirochaetaceae bacterium]|nr:XdhC family protein [Spirochaetaceae bacterium]
MNNIENSPFKVASNLEEKNIPFAWVTIVNTKGTVTRTSGRMLVQKDGKTFGTIGGGLSEHKVTLKAVECLQKGQGGLFRIEESVDNPELSYHEISIDISEINNRAIIIGGGHVAKEVATLANKCGFEICIIEKREDFAKKEIFEMASSIILTTDVSVALKSLDITERDSILALNHSLMVGQDYINSLSSKASYIGVMASHKHMNKFIGKIEFSADQNKKFHCPIGLELGGQTPSHVALAIVAELLASTHKCSSISRTTKYRPIIVRGGGDLSTATILKLHNSGYRVISLEIEKPTVIRRTVSFAQAMYDGQINVEGVTAVKVDPTDLEQINEVLDNRQVVICNDPHGTLIKILHPQIVVDGILAKKNIATKITDAPLVIALGPGFTTKVD